MNTFALEIGPDDSVRFSNGHVVLIRFRPHWRWEFYVVTQRGRSKGLERYVRQLAPAETERVDRALAHELERRLAANVSTPGRPLT